MSFVYRPWIKPTGNATFGETAGGIYDPPGLSSPMSEDGSRVFFQTPDSLVPQDTNGTAPVSAKFGTPTSTDVYQWSASGGVGLISSGKSSNPAVLQSTTPSGDDVLFTSTRSWCPRVLTVAMKTCSTRGLAVGSRLAPARVRPHAWACRVARRLVWLRSRQCLGARDRRALAHRRLLRRRSRKARFVVRGSRRSVSRAS